MGERRRACLDLVLSRKGTAGSGQAEVTTRCSVITVPRYLSLISLLVRAELRVAVAVTPCSAPPAVAGTMSLTGQEKFETAPTDKRFPTTNQAKHCYM